MCVSLCMRGKKCLFTFRPLGSTASTALSYTKRYLAFCKLASCATTIQTNIHYIGVGTR